MFAIDENERERLIQLIEGEFVLTAPQRLAIKTEILTDPAGRGYDSASNRAKLRLLNEVYYIPNPTPQDLFTPIPDNELDLSRQMVKDLVTNGQWTQLQARKYLTRPDPTYQSRIEQTPRINVVLGGSFVITLDELVRALQ